MSAFTGNIGGKRTTLGHRDVVTDCPIEA
jgi:hypothetical protein